MKTIRRSATFGDAIGIADEETKPNGAIFLVKERRLIRDGQELLEGVRIRQRTDACGARARIGKSLQIAPRRPRHGSELCRVRVHAPHPRTTAASRCSSSHINIDRAGTK